MHFVIVCMFLLCMRLKGEIHVLNGFGDPVDWWFIIKLPAAINDSAYHCPCIGDRGSGYCYLYADSERSELQYFENLGYGCLGQGKLDPLSQTLLQMEKYGNTSHWGYYNDQFKATAGGVNNSYTCSGNSNFNAHSKGCFCYDQTFGGFLLQSSTPNYPDPTMGSTFIKLGSQVDNNVKYGQHFFAMNLDYANIEKAAKALRSARLCSFNHYQHFGHENDQFPYTLLSESIRVPNAAMKNSYMYQAMAQSHLPEYNTSIDTLETKINRIQVPLVVKSKKSIAPPWALFSAFQNMDLSVASWWDAVDGIPTICAGDNFLHAEDQFCLVNPLEHMHLNRNGAAMYNVENIIHLGWKISEKLHIQWNAFGGIGSGNNHGKWAISTPRQHHIVQPATILGDLNMQGFPCTKNCAGSQDGRGGAFIMLYDSLLWHSMANKLINTVCSCHPTTSDYIQHRMCGFGCQHHMKTFDEKALPNPSNNATSFWQKGRYSEKSAVE